MGLPDDWPSEADLDALVDLGQIQPVAEAPVVQLAQRVIDQLERTLGGLQGMAGGAWQADVDALSGVRARVARLAYAPEGVALPALDRLLHELERAGQTDFAARLDALCDDIDRVLAEHG